MEDLTGKQFGPYEIVAPLGEGGMAAVYKAYQPAMERYVALKVLPRHLADDAHFVARFRREAKLLAQLQHPHILPVFDYGQAEGYTYIVMPFVESGTLADSLKGQPLALGRIRQVISQVGDALDYAHARGLIHRDVKPSNVLIDEGGNCLLTDFGLARIVEGSASLTTSGAIMGTPAYMSPEQGSGQKIDTRSDIYSLGIILYEMATGRVPYRAETPVAVIFKHIQDPLPPVRALNPKTPETVERVILKALSKSAEDRYQTAGDMVRAIQAAIPGMSPIASPRQMLAGQSATAQTPTLDLLSSEAPSSTLRGMRKRATHSWIWPTIGGIVVLGVIGGLFVVLPRGSNSASQTPVQRAPIALLATATIQSTLPTTASAGSVLFEEDFEDGRSQHIASIHGNWRIVTENGGNNVYDIDNSAGSEFPAIGFGSTEWADYATEFRLRFLSGEVSEAILEFRRNPDASRKYVVSVDINAIGLSYTVQGTGWLPIVAREWIVEPRIWHLVRVEVQGVVIRIYADGFLAIDTDDSQIGEGSLLISVSPGTHAQFDDIRVSALGE